MIWREFGKTEYLRKEDKKKFLDGDTDGIKCTFCLAVESINEKSSTLAPGINAFDRKWDVYWKYLCVGENGEKLFLHYAIDITAQVEIIDEIRARKEFVESLVELNKADLGCMSF